MADPVNDSNINERLKALAAEFERLQKSLEEQTKEREDLEEQLRKLNQENAELLKSLYYLTREEVTFEPEELAQMEAEGLTLSQVIREIEQMEEIKRS